MKRDKYLFVNKTARSERLTQSSGIQRSEIQSHVQNGLPRPRKIKGLSTEDNATKMTVDAKALYNPCIREMSCKLDPFHTACIRIDRTVRGLLHYYIYYYHPTIWTYNPHAGEREPYAFKSSVIQVVNTALEDALAMYCVLTAAAARIRHVDGLPFPGSDEMGIGYMQQALSLMQERIIAAGTQSHGAIDKLVSCMVFLGSAEAYQRDYTAAQTHLQAATRLLEPHGGVLSLSDQNLRGQIWMSDLALACIKLQPCINQHCDYDPGPVAVLNLQSHELECNDHESLAGSLLIGDGLPVEFTKAIFDILETYDTKCRLKTHAMPPSRAFETTHWIQKRNMAIRNRLLAFDLSDQNLHALRVTLIMWTLLSMNITGRVMTVKIMASKLKLILENIQTSAWSGRQNMLLWINIMGYSCADQNSEIQDWFAERVRRMRVGYGEAGGLSRGQNLLDRLVAFQKEFLYHEAVQGSITKQLAVWLLWWDDVLVS